MKTIGRHPETDGVELCFPTSVEGTLNRAGILPSYREDARACEWTNSRFWSAALEFILPTEPADSLCEKHFLCVEELFGRGSVLLNGKEVGQFGDDAKSIFADVTGLLSEDGVNKAKILFFPNETADLQKTQEVYEAQDAPMLAPRGVGGGIYIRSTSFGVIKNLSAHIKDGKVCVNADIDAANRGKYTFKYRVAQGNELAGTANVTENLIAARQSVLCEINCDVIERGATLRLTLERGGIRCDFAEIPIQFEQAALPIDSVRAVSWAPLSPNICDLTLDDYAYALMLLKNMGINAVYMRKIVEERALLHEACMRIGIAVLNEGDCGDSIKNAELADTSKGDFEQSLRFARTKPSPVLIKGLISLSDNDGDRSLLFADVSATRLYACAAGALKPRCLCFEERDGGNPGDIEGSLCEVFSVCDEPDGLPAVVELFVADVNEKPLCRRSFTLMQDKRCVSTGAFRLYSEIGTKPAAIDIKIYTADGLAAAYRKAY